MCKCTVCGRGLWGGPKQWVGTSNPTRDRARGVPPHLTMYKYPQEHALHGNTLESSLKVGACCSPRTNTVTHTCSRGNSLLTLAGQIPAPPLSPTHLHSHASSSSLRAKLERCFQNCWSVGNMTLRPAESDIHTQTDTSQTRLKCFICIFLSWRR